MENSVQHWQAQVDYLQEVLNHIKRASNLKGRLLKQWVRQKVELPAQAGSDLFNLREKVYDEIEESWDFFRAVRNTVDEVIVPAVESYLEIVTYKRNCAAATARSAENEARLKREEEGYRQELVDWGGCIADNICSTDEKDVFYSILTVVGDTIAVKQAKRNAWNKLGKLPPTKETKVEFLELAEAFIHDATRHAIRVDSKQCLRAVHIARTVFAQSDPQWLQDNFDWFEATLLSMRKEAKDDETVEHVVQAAVAKAEAEKAKGLELELQEAMKQVANLEEQLVEITRDRDSYKFLYDHACVTVSKEREEAHKQIADLKKRDMENQDLLKILRARLKAKEKEAGKLEKQVGQPVKVPTLSQAREEVKRELRDLFQNLTKEQKRSATAKLLEDYLA